MTKEAYYFSHDANARNDEKISMLRAEHGPAGYGVYWMLIETLFESSDVKLSHNKIKGIAFVNNIDIALLSDVINTCITERLFVSDGDKFWSESLIRRKEKFTDIKEKRSAAGRKGMAKRWADKGLDNSVITNDNNDITKNNKGKESKVKESKEKEIKETTPADAFSFYENNFGVLNGFIIQDIAQWVNDLNNDLVIESMKIALQNGKQWRYATGILRDWHKNNIRSLEDVAAQSKKFNRGKGGDNIGADSSDYEQFKREANLPF